MKLTSHRRHVEVISHFSFYQLKGMSEGTGCAFPCDEKGTIDLAALKEEKPCAYKNYLLCQDLSKYLAPIHEERTHSYVEPACGNCDLCGEEVALFGFTNTCDCGADYNMSGQLLAPREQWGDETGESLSDILNIA